MSSISLPEQCRVLSIASSPNALIKTRSNAFSTSKWPETSTPVQRDHHTIFSVFSGTGKSFFAFLYRSVPRQGAKNIFPVIERCIVIVAMTSHMVMQITVKICIEYISRLFATRRSESEAYAGEDLEELRFQFRPECHCEKRENTYRGPKVLAWREDLNQAKVIGSTHQQGK